MTQTSQTDQSIAVIDLGGQYCHMIGRRLRDIGVRSDILNNDASPERLKKYAGIILSGGPQSVYAGQAPTINSDILNLKRPILGICYGHQLLAHLLKCDVAPGHEEYGKAVLHLQDRDSLFEGTPSVQNVWMSHGDSIRQLANGLQPLARTASCEIAAFGDFKKNIFGVQFHPEVDHTEYGRELLNNFSRKICRVKEYERLEDLVDRLLNEIRDRVKNRSVFFFVSGGVDSTVAFTLCARALPRNKIIGVYVDTGLMRHNETAELRALLASAGLSDRLTIIDESERFLRALNGKTDPEEKRKIIGRLFVEIQSAAMHEYGIDQGNWLLGQGTIFPDTVESGGTNATTATIKTHHNRCDEIIELIANNRVIEPLSEFYKDEVRQIGKALGLDERLTGRWPFPGPGLAIRCLGVKKQGNVSSIHVDERFQQYEAVKFPIRSVGVQGDDRTFREVVAIRGPVHNYDLLAELSTSLCNNSRLYNRAIIQIAGSQVELNKCLVRREALSARRIELLRKADYIVQSTMQSLNLTKAVWQFPVVLIPVSFVGGESIVLRPVNSKDGMTANWARLQINDLSRIADEVGKIVGIDAVFLDITDKPPATIEWE